MAHETNHDYHILRPSIWPFLGSVGAFFMLYGLVLFIHDKGAYMFVGGLIVVLYVMYGWWSEMVHEGNHGEHTPVVRLGLKYGFILFIMSEVMFFAAWFWSFFKHAMYPGGPEQPAAFQTYPPVGVQPFDPWHLPLINTMILLTSGAAITWAHHALVHENNRKDLVRGLALTIGLGILFTVVQAYEYTHAHFGFAGNIYGANFFMATGFHGTHVIIGTLFLFVCMMRAMRGDFTQKQHVGFESAAWYWHFVDVVWLFLFASIYIWGSSGVAH